MAKIGDERLSIAIFGTPNCCGECPMHIYSGYDGRMFCKHPDGPGKVKDEERHEECPLRDFIVDVTFRNENKQDCDEK